MPRRSHGFGCSTAIIALAATTALAQAADTTNFVPTAIKAPERIADASSAMFAQNVQPDLPPHPTLPIGRFYQVVRYMADNSIDAPVATDFGRFPDSYAWPPFRGMALTGLSVPDPKSVWQRASSTDATGYLVSVSAALQRCRPVHQHVDDCADHRPRRVVPRAGLEPARPVKVWGFSCHFDFRRPLRVRGLEHAFTVAGLE